MKCKVEILPSAWENLKQIDDYYILHFDVQTALKVSDHILDTIERLEQLPDSGSAAPDDWLNEQGNRMIIWKNMLPFTGLFMKRCMYITLQICRRNTQNYFISSPGKILWEKTGGNVHDV